MAGCSIVVLALGLGAAAIVALISYFGMLGLCLIAGIVFLVLSSVVMKIPEVRAKHKVLRVVCIVLGVLLIVFSGISMVASVLVLAALGG